MKTFTLSLLFFVLMNSVLGQTSFQHTVTKVNKAGHITTLDHKALNNHPDAKLFVTQNGKFNPNEIGVWYNNNQWHIFNQNRQNLAIGTQFSVFVPPHNANNAFTVTTNSENTTGHITTLDNALVNNHSNSLLFVTQRYGKYNTSPVGVWFSNDKWKIYNEDRSQMPQNTMFNVLVLDEGENQSGSMSIDAFRHMVNGVAGGGSVIEPEIRNQSAQLFLTNHWVGTYNTNAIGTRYNGEEWIVFNQNTTPLKKGFQVNVFMQKNQPTIQLPSDVVIVEKPDLPTPVPDEIYKPNLPKLTTYKKTVKLPLHTSPSEITYVLDSEGMAMFEGDIVLGQGHNFTIEKPEPHPTPRTFSEYGQIGAEKYGKISSAIVIRQSDGIIDRDWLWPNGVIPYHIRLNFSDTEKELIREAIDELNTRTNLNIYPTGLIMKKNIEFVKRDAVLGDAQGSSRVGRNRTSRHRIRLKEGFTKGTVIHEILHAAGMWHEQSRRDRDRFVDVRYENIDDDYEHNFDIHDTDAEIITPYDFNSIMHYNGWAFSQDGSPTIVNRSTGTPVPQNTELSDYDIDGINTIYPVDYYGEFSRVPTTLRTVSIRVDRIISRDLDGPGDENEFWIKSEIGPGFEWRPGNSSNPTRRQSSGKKRTSNLEVEPDWTHSHLLEAGEQYAKIWLLLREDDGLASNERKDDTFNINPFPGIDHLELKIDTYTNQIYLGNIDGVFHEENYIGDVGDEIELEGFEGGFKAYIVFQVLIR